MRLKHLTCLMLMLACAPGALASTEAINIAVTIKPLHSLVAAIMKGAGEPRLIMSTSASPHHYTLRPSERQALAEADLVFWVGPELESFMPRILQSLESAGKSVALLESPGLVRLPARTVHHHDGTHSGIDPHIWLSADNADAMVDVIAGELTRLDPANSATYETNRERLHTRISETDERIRARLSNKSSAFLRYHDAYQYFEAAYGLNIAGFVSSGDETGPGAKHVRELRYTIRDQQLRCLFYEAPNRPALVDTLTAGFEVTVLELDAIGLRLEPGENAWFEIMLNLAETYDSCL